MAERSWTIAGELVLGCNCTVFCPCVLSLGQHPPTEGFCQMWVGVRIDQGRFGSVDLGRRHVGLMFEVPGPVSRGNWTSALFVDKTAPRETVEALTEIFTGRAGGPPHLLSILVADFLGVQQAPISYRREGETRIFTIEKVIEGVVEPIRGKNAGENVVIRNSEYWIGPEIIVARAGKSRLRAFGRNWNFPGRSAEICRVDWSNR
jgi:hypothetical protein